MARGKTLIKKGAVERATRGLLAGAAAAGVTGDVEVDLVRGTIKFHMTASDSGASLPAPAEETSEDIRKLL